MRTNAGTRRLNPNVLTWLHVPLQTRGYVSRQGRALRAEPLGRVLTAFLASYFPRYVDYGFTAGLESRLDDVSGGPCSTVQPHDFDKEYLE
jgi:DNA topoisomerase IA